MKSWGLQTRIIAGFVFVAAIVFLMGVIGLYSGAKLSGHITNLGDNVLPSIANLWKVNEAQSSADAAFFAQLSPTISPERRQVELKNLQDSLKRIDEGFEGYAKTYRYPEEDRIYKSVTAIWDKWKNAMQEMISLNDQFRQYNLQNPRQKQIELLEDGKGNTDEYQNAQAANAAQRKIYDYISTVERPLFTQATDELGKLIDFNENVGVEAKKTGQSDITFSSVLTILSMLIGTAVAVVFGVYFSNTIAKPLGAKIAGVVGVAEQVAGGDLTKSVPPTEAADEIGRLQNAIRKMIFNLNSFITQVQKSGIQVTTSTTQIAASGKELEATVAEQVASTKQVSSTAQEIATTSRKLVKTMEQVASMAQTTAQSAGSSQKDLSQMENVMRHLAHATTAITDKLGVMNEKANNINNVVTTITKVADQTNLLSLNAAIEAEKAGEYGAGFAVVAREIRRLADQTAVATLEIEQMVKEMQAAVSTGVMEMDKFSKAVNDSVEKVVFIGEQLAQVITQVQGLTPRFQEVSQSMEEQSEGAQQINESMEQLIQASMQTSDALRETNSALTQLDDAAQGLQKEIARFRVV